MASLSMRVVSVAVALVLSGTPAALAACAAVCLPGVAGAMVMSHAVAVVPVAAALAAASPHAHHQTSVADAAPGSHRVRPVTAAVAGVGSHDCCPDAGGVPATAATLVRGDARLGALAAVATAFLTTRPIQTSSRNAFALSVTDAPPLRSRTPLVLRI